MAILRRVLGAARWSVGLGVVAVVVAVTAWTALRARVGDPVARLEDPWHEGHRIVDRNGALLRELPSEAGRRGRPLPLDQIGERLVITTLVSEDRSFFEHDGVDRGALARAVKQNVVHGRMVSGASTVTQQLVKMLDGGGDPPPRTVGGKIEEMARAQNLEESLEKEEILAAYLNRLPYGHGLVGPEAAARGYFGVASRELSWAQAAYLAILPRAPSFLDPYRHPERVRLRQAALLEALHETGHLDRVELERALAETLEPRRLARPFFAPHLVETLRSRDGLSEGGVTRTTIDLELQKDTEGMVSTHLAALENGLADDAAVVVVDNRTGDVLAYVGSADFHDPAIAGQVDMVRAPRQPGSTLKPFVYALAFANGHSGPEMLADVPTRFVEAGGEYDPRNFHRGFEGPISAREALASSLNVPAVRLAAELGTERLLTFLRAIGFESLDREADHYGLALALGSGEVKLWELTRAYVVLARGGESIELQTTRQEGEQGDHPVRGVALIEPEVAAAVTEALSDPLARVRLLRGRSPFDLGFPVAVKTGTSSGYRDTWAVGYTAERTVAVWLGNADGSPTHELTGGGAAGPLFGDVMRRAMRDVSARAPLWDAELLTSIDVCPLSGRPPSDACPDRVRRRFALGAVPSRGCEVHRHARRRHAASGQAPYACDPGGREVVAVFPPKFTRWLEAHGLGAPGQDADGVPWYAAGTVPGCGAEARDPGVIRIASPVAGTVFMSERGGRAEIFVRASLEGGDARDQRSIEEVEFLVDDAVVGRSARPFELSVELAAGDHELIVRPVNRTLPVRSEPARVSVR